MRSRKTPEQQQAWKELLLLINDPEWYLDKVKTKRHKELMEILEPEEQYDPREQESIRLQRYLDARPGMEADIADMLRNGLIYLEIRKKYRIDPKIFSLVRKKHGIEKHGCVKKPSKRELEVCYCQYGLRATVIKFNVSKATIYKWLASYKIPTNKTIQNAKTR
ncbi:hypothetical protein [Enterococcus hermanniensis]